MEIANKTELVHELIHLVDELSDLRGVNKCVAIVNIIQKLHFLEKVIADDDSNHESAIRSLTNEIEALKTSLIKEEKQDA